MIAQVAIKLSLDVMKFIASIIVGVLVLHLLVGKDSVYIKLGKGDPENVMVISNFKEEPFNIKEKK